MLYRPDIDGLRAIAVLSVIAFHAFPVAVPGGFVGVDVFFVISGFLISGIVIQQLEAGRFSFATFYARRARRILPALLLVVAVSILCGWRLLLPEELRELGKEAAAAAGFVSNLLFWREDNYFTASDSFKPLLNLWSLGVEEQFYLVWPLLLVLAFKLRISALTVIAVIGLLSLYHSVHAAKFAPIAAFFLTTSRLWELLAGALLAYVTFSARGRAATAAARARVPERMLPVASNAAAIAGMLLVLGSGLCITKEMRFPGALAMAPVAGAFLLIAAGPRAAINRWLLAHPLMVSIGLISYPLYLWHWPALVFSRALSIGPAPAMATAAALAVTAVLSWLTYRFVELPLRTRRGPIAPLALGAASIVAAGIGIEVMRSDGYPGRFPPEVRHLLTVRTEDLMNAWRHERCFLSDKQGASAFATECVDAPPGELVAIWGDSHGASLYAGARRFSGVRLAQFTASDCPPVLKVEAFTPRCNGVNDAVLKQLKWLRPRYILINGQWISRWQQVNGGAQIQKTIEAAKAYGEVVVVGPAPSWFETMPRILLAYARRDFAWRMPERVPDQDPKVAQVDAELAAIAAKAGVAYISPYRILCNAGGCLTMVDAQLSSVDRGHLSEAGAALVLEQVFTAQKH